MGAELHYIDIHNHSVWSDGENTQQEIIENAIQHGISTVGICDHFGLAEIHSVSQENLLSYIDSINVLRKQFISKTKVLAGLEIPVQLMLRGFDPNIINSFNKLDFIMIEDIEYFNGGINFDKLEHILDSMTCTKGLAYCDLLKLCTRFGFSLDMLASKMKQMNLFWEINSAIQHSFFDDVIFCDQLSILEISTLFDVLNNKDIKVAAGSDTHSIELYTYGRLVQANKTILEHLIPMEF